MYKDEEKNNQTHAPCNETREEVVISLRSKALHKLSVVFRDFEREIGINVQHTGVFQGQHRLLMTLYRSPEINQVEIAEKLNVSPASVATMLKKLEQGGYIDRSSKLEDNRANKIFITEKGKEVIDESKKIFNEIDKKAFQNFSEDEILKLIEYLTRMSENFKG